MTEYKLKLIHIYPQNNKNINRNERTDIVTKRATFIYKDERVTKYNIQQCPICKEGHKFYKFQKYKELTSIEANKLCCSCFEKFHFASKCKSRNTCFKEDCSKKHHATLHGYFVQRKGTKDRPKMEKDKKRDNQKTISPKS